MTKKIIVVLLLIICLYGAYNVNAEFQNNNPLLKSLKVNVGEITPVFDCTVTEYELILSEEINEIEVEAIPDDGNAKVYITGNRYLMEGVNRIYIEVIAEDGNTKKTYVINALKGNIEKSTPNLKELSVKGYVLIPEFNPNITDYVVEIKDNQKKLDIQTIAENENANIEIKGNDSLNEDSNVITINITSEDESNSKTYTILAVKEGRDKDNEVKQNTNTYLYILIIAIIVIVSLIVIIMLYIRRKNHEKN